eukprot:352421-Chlamydomonas_euryale.AAC.65
MRACICSRKTPRQDRKRDPGPHACLRLYLNCILNVSFSRLLFDSSRVSVHHGYQETPRLVARMLNACAWEISTAASDGYKTGLDSPIIFISPQQRVESTTGACDMARTGVFLPPGAGGDSGVPPVVRLVLLAGLAALLWRLWTWKIAKSAVVSNSSSDSGPSLSSEVVFVNDMRRATQVQKLQQQYEDSLRTKRLEDSAISKGQLDNDTLYGGECGSAPRRSSTGALARSPHLEGKYRQQHLTSSTSNKASCRSLPPLAAIS